MSKVEITSSCLVRVSTTIPLMSRLELSPWDLRFLTHKYMKRGLLFHKPQSDHNLIDSLKNSLSRTLHFFPPLAGRLATIQNNDNTECFFVDCNNAGAEFVHAVAGDVCVSDIMEPKCVPEELVSSFFPLKGVLNFEGNSKPLVAVQVTELVDGIFIGLAANHSVVDGISFWHFFNSWSEISRGFETISKTPVFERTFPTIPLPPSEKIIVTHNHVFVERVFEFSKESVAKIKGKANSEAGTNKISSLQALSAHLWKSYTRCRRNATDDQIRVAVFVMIMGARGRIPLPDGYFGNAVFSGVTSVPEAEVLKKGLGYAALKINDTVAQQTKESAIKEIEEWIRNPVPPPTNTSFSLFVITGSPRHDVYGNDFGWGKPIAVRCGMANFEGNMTTFPSATAGGIEVHACLTPETCRKMENDADFMEAFLS